MNCGVLSPSLCRTGTPQARCGHLHDLASLERALTQGTLIPVDNRYPCCHIPGGKTLLLKAMPAGSAPACLRDAGLPHPREGTTADQARRGDFGGCCSILALRAENRSHHEHPSSASRAGLQKASKSTADARHQADGTRQALPAPSACSLPPCAQQLRQEKHPSSADWHLGVPKAWQEAAVHRAELPTAYTSGPAGSTGIKRTSHPSAFTELICQRQLQTSSVFTEGERRSKAQ